MNHSSLFFCTESNDFKSFYQTQIILFTINHKSTHSEAVTNKAVLHKLFYSTLLIHSCTDKLSQVLLCIIKIQLNISHLSTHGEMIEPLLF